MQSCMGGRRAWKSESTARSKVSRSSRHFNREWSRSGRNGSLPAPKERRWLKKMQALENDRAYWQQDTTTLLIQSDNLLQQLTRGGEQ